MKVIEIASSLRITIRNGEELITDPYEVSTHDVHQFIAFFNNKYATNDTFNC